MSARPGLAIAIVLVGGCGDPTADPVDAGGGDDVVVDAATNVDAAVDQCVAAGTYELSIEAGAFPPSVDHPNVNVRVPPGFDRAPPVDVVVYIHGFYNCITNILGDTDTECTPGDGTRIATGLATQLEASGRNALLVLPEVRF